MNHIDLVVNILATVRRSIGDLRSSGAALGEALHNPLLNRNDTTALGLQIGHLYTRLDCYEATIVKFEQSVRTGIPMSELPSSVVGAGAGAAPLTTITDAQSSRRSSSLAAALLTASSDGESFDVPTKADRPRRGQR